MRAIPDSEIIGHRFGRLVAVAEQSQEHRQRRFLCQCDCGGSVVTKLGSLRRGETQSCGCIRREMSAREKHATIHGECHKTPEHRSWQAMRARCLSAKHSAFKNYGGRGITICERWDDYRNFLEDMGRRPAGTTLDRIDNDGNYEPGNCRWATPAEQLRNRRVARIIEFDGERMNVSEAARRFGLSSALLRWRLDAGWAVPDALGAPQKSPI